VANKSLAQDQRQQSQYIDFWNSVLVPKFIRWKHIIVDGLTLHSEAIFPTLLVKPGDKVVDAGCGFGDTAIKLAKFVTHQRGSTFRICASLYTANFRE
jgi:ubiquinone/menaquinone biosynthesis C-methylase UbiE